jgi:hypothetical protein
MTPSPARAWRWVLPTHPARGDLVVFAYQDAKEIVRGCGQRKQMGPPTWKPIGRRAIEILVGGPV